MKPLVVLQVLGTVPVRLARIASPALPALLAFPAPLDPPLLCLTPTSTNRIVPDGYLRSTPQHVQILWFESIVFSFKFVITER